MNKSVVQIPLPRARKVIAAAAFAADMKEALRALVAGSGFSREHFADAMNDYARLAGRGKEEGKAPLISVAKLEKLLADEERGQLPTIWEMEVMCRVAESLAPHECWLAMHDCGVMDEKAWLKVKLAKLDEERKALMKRLRDKA